jgi:regulator of sigma E protease
MTLIIFLFFLGLLILVHEFGHFFAARRVGLKVEEFSIGFPPKIFSKKIKETVYSVGLILFGGFVRLKGEDDPEDKEGFWHLSASKRLLIVLAGIFFNIFLAYFLISLSLLFGYPVESQKIFVSGFLSKNSQGAKFFKVGDEILGINLNNKFHQFKNPQELSKFLKANQGKELEIIFLRNNQKMSAKVIPPIGFYIANFSLIKYPFPQNFLLGFSKTFSLFKKIIEGFFLFLKSLFTKEKVDLEVVGPVGIYNLFDNFKNFGLGYILYFVAILSLNLALINAFPFPALDGGRTLFIFLEIIRGRKIDFRKEEIIHKIGFAFLFFLLILITIKDIFKLWLK